jgi:hypothetical protein
MGFVYAHPRSTKRRVEEQQERGNWCQRGCLAMAGVWVEEEGRALDARILSSLCRDCCIVHVSLGAVPQARCRVASAALCVFGIAGPAFTSASWLIPNQHHLLSHSASAPSSCGRRAYSDCCAQSSAPRSCEGVVTVFARPHQHLATCAALSDLQTRRLLRP